MKTIKQKIYRLFTLTKILLEIFVKFLHFILKHTLTFLSIVGFSKRHVVVTSALGISIQVSLPPPILYKDTSPPSVSFSSSSPLPEIKKSVRKYTSVENLNKESIINRCFCVTIYTGLFRSEEILVYFTNCAV